jgi:hypothetical protein
VLCEETKGEAIIATGVGQHQMFAAQWYNYTRPRHWLTSGGLGSMGFGLPSALGAAAAFDGKNGREKKVVVDIDGDGSFLMNVQELATVHIDKLDVKTMILNNQHLGMVVQWEDRFYKVGGVESFGGTASTQCKGCPAFGCMHCSGALRYQPSGATRTSNVQSGSYLWSRQGLSHVLQTGLVTRIADRACHTYCRQGLSHVVQGALHVHGNAGPWLQAMAHTCQLLQRLTSLLCPAPCCRQTAHTHTWARGTLSGTRPRTPRTSTPTSL